MGWYVLDAELDILKIMGFGWYYEWVKYIFLIVNNYHDHDISVTNISNSVSIYNMKLIFVGGECINN